MPIIEVSLKDLERLSKVKISHDVIDEMLEFLKLEIIAINEDRLTYEVSHDRPDLFSSEGLARALSYLKGVRAPSKYKVHISKFSLDVKKAPSYRPYCLMGIVRNLTLDDEAIKQIMQLQEKLHISYGSNRKLVSIGLYDLHKVKPPFRYITVKNARYIPLGYNSPMSLGEILTKTDKGKEYSHLVKKGEYPLLIDSTGKIMSFPPVLNSEETKITENSTDVIVDVTGSEPFLMSSILSVVLTSLAERSLNPLIESVEIITSKSISFPFNRSPILSGEIYKVDLRNLKEYIGLSLDSDNIESILSKMGYGIEHCDRSFAEVWVPPYRIDVHDEMDIVEDITIGYGYNRLETEVLPPTHFGNEDPLERFAEIIRDSMIGLGVSEVIDFLMIDSDLLKAVSDKPYIEIANPKMKTYSAIRNSLIPSLVLTAKENLERFDSIKVFEIGSVVVPLGNSFSNQINLGMLLMGNYTLTDGLVIVKSLISYLGGELELSKTTKKPFLKGRTALLNVNGVEIGIIGEVSPEILAEIGILKPLVIAEISLNDLRRALTKVSE